MATKNKPHSKKDKTKYQSRFNPRFNRGNQDQQVASAKKTARKKKYTQEEVWALGKNIPPVPADLSEPQLSETAFYIAKTRYALRNDKSEPIESAREMFWRVAYNIACADLLYHGDRNKMIEQAQKFYNLMASQKFIPNTPTMLNAGKPMQQLSACFVLPIEDDMKSIAKTLVDMVMIHKSGGGTGFSFSRLRPYGDVIKSSGGTTVGPTSFLQAYNDVTSQIKQGGVRRGANMGIMHITHPDILRFAVMKVDEFNLTNFNISVTVTEEWMDQVGKDQRFVNSEPDWEEVIGEIKSAQTIRDVDLKLKKTEDGVRKLYDLVKATQPDEGYDLINPRSQQTVGKLNAYKVFLLITQLAWHYGDPGMIMIDRINKSGANPTPHLGQIEATNPCVTGDALISTGGGLIPMKEGVESHFAGGKRFGGNMSLIIDTRTLNHKTGGTLPGRAVKFFDNGIKEVWRLTTKSGFTLTATPDHQLLTPKGWVKLRDLNTGDIVLIQSGRGEFGKNRQLPIISKIPTMPNDWSKELGMVLGWLIGDGWVRTGDKNCRVGFTFGKDDLDSLNYIQNLMNNWYGKDVKAVKRERNNTHLSYHSRGLVDFFVKLGVKPVKAADKLVPESIYTAPVEAVVGFLQGLFTADGTVNFKKGRNAYVRLTSKSKLLLQGVQLLLLNLGIYSKIYDRSRDSRMGMFPYKNKSGQLKTYTLDGVLFELSISKQSVMKFLSEVGFLSDRHQDKISKFSTQDFYADKFVDTVSEIKPFGRQRVYDLTEEKSLTFITNGIVSLDCGEQPLLPYDACTLGSINLGKFVKDGQIDYQALGEVSQECVHFLDNVLDMNAYPIAEIAEMTRKVRRIGLGVMGLADLLVQVEIGYNTDDGLSLAEDVMAHIQESAKEGSIKLAQVRGVFPAWKGSIFDDKSPHFLGKKLMIRNAAVTTIAPTGTIAMLADASSGIEPYFALSYAKNTIEGKRLFNINPFFLEIAKREGFYSEELLEKVEQNSGSVAGLAEVPERWQKVFVVTRDITPEWHVKMQAAFQKHVDNAISKTINFSNSATVEDVRHAYMMVYETGCKGITIYRDGSRQKQILEVKKEGSYYDQLAGKPTGDGVSKNGHDKTIAVGDDMTPYLPTAKPLKAKAPGEAWGVRLKKKSDVGNVYTAVYRDADGKPVEVFINVGKSGGYVAGAAEVTGRLASLALKHGAALEEVAAELVGIACGIPYGVGPNAILSMFDAAGKSVLEAAKTKQLPLAIDNGEFEVSQHDGHTKDNQQESLLQAPEQVGIAYKTLFASCPDCGSQLVLAEGCQKCLNPGCGYSKC